MGVIFHDTVGKVKASWTPIQRITEGLIKVIVATVVVSSSAAPQGYHLDTPLGPSFGLRGSGSGFGRGVSGVGFGREGLASGFSSGGCGPGRVLHVDGRCVIPRVNRKVYLYDTPPVPVSHGPPPYIPEPTVETNILFIRAPEQGQGPDPIVIPPPRQEHVVYVLNKESPQQQEVIELPAPPASEPEVYFVNYGDGENPVLPSGVDLQTALNAASQGGGQVVEGGAGGVVGGFGGSGGISAFGGSGGIGSGGIGGFGGSGAIGGFGGSGEIGDFGGSGGIGGFVGGGENSGFGSSAFNGGLVSGGNSGELVVSRGDRQIERGRAVWGASFGAAEYENA
ncbi:pupal cuticle protein 36-like [Penaeus indicus]|uniref:pupal cuticle protein 36-like n=1 Tax=Penaeus indicus TaxID=29960 RepID=UPI00300C9E21